MGRWVDLDKQLILGNKASAAGILGRNCTRRSRAFRWLEGRLVKNAAVGRLLMNAAVVGMASKLMT